MTSTFTTEFGHEYEQERGRWLRRRFLWYAGVSIGLNLIGLLFSTALVVFILATGVTLSVESVDGGTDLSVETGITEDGLDPTSDGLVPADGAVQGTDGDDATETGAGSPEQRRALGFRGALVQQLASIPALLIAIVLYYNAFRRVKRSSMSRDELLSLVSRLIIYAGAAGTVCLIIGFESLKWIAPDDYQALKEVGFARETGRAALIGVMLSHFLASLFLPWTPRESLRPILPLALLNFGVAVFYSWSEPQGIAVAILLSLLIAVPGLAVCWLRTSRFRSKFHFKMVTRRYGEMKDELDAARQIHDAMFPAPIEDGPIHMRYAYEPMRQIGGDYLFAHRVSTGVGESRGLMVVLIDVTGHGITAALTVNRLQGEIERQVSMNRAVSPGKVLSELNDYLHHTLAAHSVYATAMVMKFDPDEQTVVWASAGHPPGFICTLDGNIRAVESTTIVLGATRGEHFTGIEETLPFREGDTLLAYTDGAIEAKNIDGRMLRIEGVEKFLAGHCKAEQRERNLPAALLEYVHGFRAGPAQDDSLIVEIHQPLK